QQPFSISSLQLADDIQHITTGTEGASGASDYDYAQIFFIPQRPKEISEFAIDFKGYRVQTLRAVERNRRDSVALFVEKRFRIIHTPVSRYLSMCSSTIVTGAGNAPDLSTRAR